MSERAVVIVNPRSNLGRTGKQLGQLCARLDAKLDGYDLSLTRAPGHASELVQAAVARGAQHVVACGGDGTLSEVADGVLSSGRASDVAVSLLAFGTGSDLTRSLGEAPDGAARTRHVLNAASAGLSAESVRWVQAQAERGKRNRFSYQLAAFAGLARYQVSAVQVTVDDVVVQQGALCFCAIANGRYFGGGMPVAPEARLDDGLLDVVSVAGLRLWETIPFFARLLRGTHVTHPRTRVVRGREVSLESSAPVWLEIDGEPVGLLPVRISVVPAALKLRHLNLATPASTTGAA
jgi:diacylglycerol kinase (ATP)